ncbi:leucine-rich repeat domain-containing protein [Spirosoma sp. KUDC1026]|uniref:leucine-rich repeat domain-containing protein n=1 Tax=Spirosoma sp. KUDC1026 TaxID=2745947 RepID=UPI00159B999F|nr:leucine-rich repeat domain-containing protein [Spirosoma sp. KUDC1026]QKZ14111.1 leucine-rich repeat domain-containing protein [Spirosoma sp. KUDC1026]
MKPVLRILPFLAALSVTAQVQVRSTVDLTDSTKKQLMRTYLPAIKPGEQATVKDIAYEIANGNLVLDFRRFLHKRRFQPKDEALLILDGYFQSSGQADLITYRLESDKLWPADQERVLTDLIREFFATHPLAVRSYLSATPFHYHSFIMLSRDKPRRVKPAKGTISDLSTAAQTNRPDTVTRLVFSGLLLDTIPALLYRFTNVEEIDLGSNNLTRLPARLTTLPRLKRLNLMTNLLTEDSIAFSRNKHLAAINLQRNRLTHAPTALRKNRRLTSLWLGNNDLLDVQVSTLRRLNDLNLYNVGLTVFPKSLLRLKKLKQLDLYYNKLTTLPAQLGKLRRLEQLAVAHNDLSALPKTLPKLRRLQALYLHHNRIGQLPARLEQLNQLRVLDLGYNWLSVPPTALTALPALEDLDMSNNNLQELPASLAGMKQLKHLYLRSNPFIQRGAKTGPYAGVIQQLEANKTEVFY